MLQDFFCIIFLLQNNFPFLISWKLEKKDGTKRKVHFLLHLNKTNRGIKLSVRANNRCTTSSDFFIIKMDTAKCIRNRIIFCLHLRRRIALNLKQISKIYYTLVQFDYMFHNVTWHKLTKFSSV